MNFSKSYEIEKIKSTIKDIPDFPLPGIIFRDITPVLADGELFQLVTDLFARRYRQNNVTKVVGVEARGFILGAALAHALGAGFIPVRKKGKLPGKTLQESYTLEYGNNMLEIHDDCIQPGEHVLIIDDVLATGGTAAATAQLIKRMGGVVTEMAFLLELKALNGRNKLKDVPIYSIIEY